MRRLHQAQWIALLICMVVLAIVPSVASTKNVTTAAKAAVQDDLPEEIIPPDEAIKNAEDVGYNDAELYGSGLCTLTGRLLYLRFGNGCAVYQEYWQCVGAPGGGYYWRMSYRTYCANTR